MRLDKFVCKSTEFDREAAWTLIHAGTILVNGAPVTDERTQVHENNCITLHGKPLVPRPFRYLLLHKMANTVCSNIDEAYPSIFSALELERTSELHVAGRLDADTTGLVLATDDGRWSFDIIRPSMLCHKVYRVGLSYPIADDAIEGLIQTFARGIPLQGETTLTRPAKLDVINPQEVLLTLSEGKYHQVKRMIAHVGNRVRSLHREKIGSVSLDIAAGQWRELTAAEIDSFARVPVNNRS